MTVIIGPQYPVEPAYMGIACVNERMTALAAPLLVSLSLSGCAS
jgi:hypothetical protein